LLPRSATLQLCKKAWSRTPSADRPAAKVFCDTWEC
jgi:hypothetical protein